MWWLMESGMSGWFWQPWLDLFKKTLFITFTRKITFNIDGTTIHSSPLILNCKDLPSLSYKQLDSLIKIYDQL
jgi:hypothetical protein